MNNKKIHTHPTMEKRLRVPQNHCIIDRDMFNEIFKDNKTNLEVKPIKPVQPSDRPGTPIY